MRAIEIRENTISNCLNLLHVIYNNSPKDGDQKNMNSNIHLYKNDGNNNTSFESLQDIANMNSIDISEDDKIFSSYRNDSNLYQKEFIEVLREVQFASLDVIRLIQLCRRSMWRPNPIIYQKEGWLYVSIYVYIYANIFMYIQSYKYAYIYTYVCIFVYIYEHATNHSYYYDFYLLRIVTCY
jgi:hypothetical protein